MVPVEVHTCAEEDPTAKLRREWAHLFSEDFHIPEPVVYRRVIPDLDPNMPIFLDKGLNVLRVGLEEDEIQLEEQKQRASSESRLRRKYITFLPIGKKLWAQQENQPRYSALTQEHMGQFLSTFDKMFCKVIKASVDLQNYRNVHPFLRVSPSTTIRN